jgi:hypothetical protein
MTTQEEISTESEDMDSSNWFDDEKDKFITERKKDIESKPFVKRISKQTHQTPHWSDFLKGRNR